MAIKLCNLNPSIFEVNPAANGGNILRANLVAAGRTLMVERAGRDANALVLAEKRTAEYTSAWNEQEYARRNQSFKEKLMLFCAGRVASQTCENPPADYGEFMRDQRKYMSDPTFLRTLSGVIRDIATPVAPAVMSNALNWLCQTVSVPVGQTLEIDVPSNAIFNFEDSSRGASRSKPRNRGYDKPLTLNPKMYTAAQSFKWYQLIGNNVDVGRFLNSIQLGLYSKVTALWNKAMVQGATDSAITPSGLTYTSFSSANWINLVKKTAESNGTSFRNVTAFGDLAACAKVLPSGNSNGASVNLDAALSTMLGADYVRYGYLGEFMGARVMPIDNAVVPGTQNGAVTELLPANCMYFMATNAPKPVYLGIEEGSPMEVVMTPNETADGTLDVSIGIVMEALPVFAAHIGYMSGM